MYTIIGTASGLECVHGTIYWRW